MHHANIRDDHREISKINTSVLLKYVFGGRDFRFTLHFLVLQSYDQVEVAWIPVVFTSSLTSSFVRPHLYGLYTTVSVVHVSSLSVMSKKHRF